AMSVVKTDVMHAGGSLWQRGRHPYPDRAFTPTDRLERGKAAVDESRLDRTAVERERHVPKDVTGGRIGFRVRDAAVAVGVDRGQHVIRHAHAGRQIELELHAIG